MKYVAISITMTLVACSMNPDGINSIGANSGGGSGSSSSSNSNPAIIGQQGLTVGLQNFRQLYGSWVSLTGVNPSTLLNTGGVSLATYYQNSAMNILPAVGVVGEASNSVFFTTAVFAGNVAGLFVAKEKALTAGSRRVTNLVNFAAVATQLNGASGQAIVDDVAQRAYALFVGRMPTASELLIVEQSVAACVAGSATAATTTADTSNCMLVEIAGIMNSIHSLAI
ncbi:MAG: hypothetical protein HYR96_03405 [Deltaproteobacteria bacterium]|nr:hypothetical protein [Deltaproteobacteria bacterium]MBI3294271.1 hypothetical protein [Deltaproteobacteria bacterium]